MNEMQVIEGDFSTPGTGSFDIIAARWNGPVVNQLVAGAIDNLTRHGVQRHRIRLIHVPGSYEIPLAAKVAVSNPNTLGVIALGCLVRGSTSHFDLIASFVARSLGEISLSSGKPVIFGVLTTDTMEQAMDRAGGKMGNKGAEAVQTLLEMTNLLGRLQGNGG